MSKHIKSFLGVALLLGATAGWAGGPNYTFDFENRIPYVWHPQNWPNGSVPVYTDLGNFKNSNPLITNERADQLTVSGWDQWNNVPTSTFQAQVVGDFSALGLSDINRTNVAQIIGANAFNGGGVHVIYDTDGQIFQQVLGVFGVLGIGVLEWVDTDSPEILEAYVILNGSQVRSGTADPNAEGFSGVFTHEFGHIANLGHTQANGAAYSFADPNRPRGCAAPWTSGPLAAQIETMYPFIENTVTGSGPHMASVDRIDDIAAISNLYPAPGWPENHATIRGKVLLSDEDTEITGVNVIARNVANPFNDFTSYLSGQVTKGQVGPDGSFELNGLTPGAEYVLYVDNLVRGGFNIPRFIVLPGPEEYYNGANESGDGEDDERCAWTTVTAALGAPATVDVAFNKVKGAPVFTTLGVNIVPTDMTPDGATIVGQYGPEVFRWTEAGGVQPIGGDISGGGLPAVSDDGSRVAATVKDASNILNWAIHENGAWTLLPHRSDAPPAGCGGQFGSVYDISGDGLTVVGGTYGNNTCNQNLSFRASKWTAAGGLETLAKSPDSIRANRANSVNYDGSVIVGWDDHSTGLRRGAYWINGVETVIPPLNPVTYFNGEALDVTADGSMISGISGGINRDAWRLPTATGEIEFVSANPAFTTSSAAYTLSNDGGVITGWSTTSNIRTPKIWTPGLGWTNFSLFLNAQGTYTEGMDIANALTTSADGTIIAGWGASQFGTVGWILESPKVVLCHRPPDNPHTPTHTIDVTFPVGLANHLNHGDTLGMCQHGGM